MDANSLINLEWDGVPRLEALLATSSLLPLPPMPQKKYGPACSSVLGARAVFESDMIRVSQRVAYGVK